MELFPGDPDLIVFGPQYPLRGFRAQFVTRACWTHMTQWSAEEGGNVCWLCEEENGNERKRVEESELSPVRRQRQGRFQGMPSV